MKNIRRCITGVFFIVFGFCAIFYFCFLRTHCYYFQIPVDLESCLKSARIQMSVGSHNYQVELDLGAKYCSLYPEYLNESNKKFYKFVPGLDIHGNEYRDALYRVKDVKVGGFRFSEIHMTEESPEFMAQGIFTPAKGKTIEEEIYACAGRAGRDIFGGKNFLLDFARSRIILCKSFNDLARDRYRLQEFVQVPVELNKLGVCFRVETDTGEKVLILDSGSSHSFLRTAPVEMNLTQGTFCDLPIWPSKKFILNGHDFGEKDMYLFEISPKLEGMDGTLGLDFLKQHVIYIDMQKSMAYIGKASEVL